MPSRYAEAHLNATGAGDARPTALDIIKDEGLEGKLTGKVFFITGCASGIGIETARALSATGATLSYGRKHGEGPFCTRRYPRARTGGADGDGSEFPRWSASLREEAPSEE